MRLKQPLFLKVETEEQLRVLNHALQMQYDFEADTVTDETITTVDEIRNLASMLDENIRKNVVERRKLLNEKIDNVIAIVDLQHALQRVIDASPD